jgi:glutamine synthetase
VLYDPDRPRRLSTIGEHFVAGIIEHLPVLTAITAPSAASYIRLRPNRWAPTVADLGVQDRGASVRICPIFNPSGEPAADQFNIEYRVADATACPHLAFGAVIWAGLDGIRRRLTLSGDPKPLPRSLGEALANLDASEAAREWFGDLFFDVYRQFKQSELRVVEGLDPPEICARYAEVY